MSIGNNMNYRAILHIQNSQYCYAVNKDTVEIMLRVSAEDDFERVSLIYGNKYDYYLVQKRAELSKSFTDGVFDYYSLTLSLSDVRFVYVFELKYQGKIYYFSEDGLSEKYDYSLAYYNSFQLPYINQADILREVPWMKNARFYEIFVDRFNIGDRQKDMSYINLKWGEKPVPKSFAGGDLKGIIEKLDYLKELGINAVYLTPIFKSVSNHKYDISDYFEIDGHFGDKATFKKLVESAHSKGIKIILDAVFNHCSEKLPQFRDVLKNGKKSPYHDWFMIDGDIPDKKKDNYEYFGVCKYMPKFNTSNKEVQEFLLGVATYWIKQFDIDGWRLDVADEVSHDFWRTFRKTVKAAKEDCVILGENWHDSSDFLRGDQFDGIMNYALTKACADYFARGELDARGFADRLSGLYVRNTKTVNSMMLNLLDSHDTHRFYTQCGCDVDKLMSALALIYLHTGSSCVYYGTEIPLEGGYDPDCRRTMEWNAENESLKKLLCELARLKQREEISDGDISYSALGELFIMERKAAKTLRLVINNSGKKVEYKSGGKLLLSHNYENGTIKSVGFIVEEAEN